MKQVVLVTTASELAADLVILCLKRRGIPFIRFNQEEFPHRIVATWTGYPGDGECVIGDEVLRVEDIISGWFRHPVEQISPDPGNDRTANDFIARESAGFLKGFWEMTPWFWVNRPSAVYRAESKLAQLATARRLGFRIPATLISNDPAASRTFVSNRSSIAKTVVSAGLADRDSAYAVYTRAVTAGDLTPDDAVRAAPVIFQERVPNAFDLRVTVVGNRVFATKISIVNRGNETDWRAVDQCRLHNECYELPGDLAERSIELTRTFFLNYGALDFIVTPEGEHVFLELNPSGQWGWLEAATDEPITDAIVDLLISGSS